VLPDFSPILAIPHDQAVSIWKPSDGPIGPKRVRSRQLGELHVMGKPEKPKIEDLAEELAFWNSYREVHFARGIDIGLAYANWTSELAQGLTSPGAREEFAELCEAGCFPQGLAALILILRRAPLLEKFWVEMVGNPTNRAEATRALEDAVQTFESLYADVIALGRDAEVELSKIGRIPISRIVSELRFHIKFINFAQLLREDTETHSPEELVKYLISAYVLRMTGDFHDRCVSGLIGEVVGSDGYAEVAHRMWRGRHFKRLERHYSWMVKFLIAASVVMDHTA
jgi:hypothetical protein